MNVFFSRAHPRSPALLLNLARAHSSPPSVSCCGADPSTSADAVLMMSSSWRRPQVSVRTVAARSFDHLVVWTYMRLVHGALFWASFLQGTELYNVALRLFGAKIAIGAVVFATPDLPCLLTVGASSCVVKTARLRSHQLTIDRAVSAAIAHDGDAESTAQFVRVGETST